MHQKLNLVFAHTSTIQMNKRSAPEEVCDENTRFAAAWKLHDLEVLMEIDATVKEASLQWNTIAT